MPRTSGIPLVDLFGLTDRINSALPPTFQDAIDRFVIVRHRTTRSPGAVIHHGKLQSITASTGSDVEEIDLGFGTLSVPLVTAGVPFQLSMVRQAITGSLEPASDTWQLDLKLDDFILILDFLDAAVFVPEAGTAPRHLVRDRNNRVVRIIGEATLRFEKAGADAPVTVKFIDVSDPLDPTAKSGGVASLTFSPPHFFFGSSEFGMTVRQLTYDFSDDFSPPFVIERGQSAAWMGLAIGEATLYAPRNLPALGDLSGGVKNVLIGSPTGIQGELEIQFGRTALNPQTFRFVQNGDPAERGISGAGLARSVDIEAAQDQEIRIQAAFTASVPPEGGALEDWSARWIWPGRAAVTGDASSGTVRHGQVLRVVPFENVAGQPDPIEHPEISFRFVASGTGASVRAAIGSETFGNVVHLNGTPADIGTATLTAVSTAPNSTEFAWEVPSTGQTGADTSFVPDFTGQTGAHQIVLRETPEGEDPRLTRVQVRLAETGRLLVGTEDGVFASDDDGTPLKLSAAEATFDLSDFHGSGTFNTKNEQATLDPGAAAGVNVPGDGLARVTVSEGGAPPLVEHDRHVQILMEYDANVVRGWGDKKPAGASSAGSEADLHPQLLEWAARYPGAAFLVIGRCDDIGSRGYNNTLADSRADKAVSLLTTAIPGQSLTAIAAGDVAERGEQDPFDPADSVTPADQTDVGMDANERAVDRLINLVEDQTGWPSDLDTAHAAEPIRRTYRRSDIYALGGAPTDDAIRRTLEPGRAPDLRRSLVPATGRDVAPAEAPTPKIDYRVKLVLGWDKPTASGFGDAVPNLAEVEFAWSPNETPLPSLGGKAVDTSREILTLYGKWIYDDLTGFTRLTLGIRSDGDPNGLISSEQSQLTVALAFGPMLLSGVDFQDDTVGAGARLTALVAGSAFAEVDLGGGPLVGDGSKVALIAMEAEAETRTIQDPGAAFKIKIVAEYTTVLHLNGGALGLKTDPDRPMKIRYKDVGIEFDNTKPGWEKVGFAYKTDSMQIEDPGKWQIDGILGQLLRIVEVSMGNGSLWIEGRIAIAVNIGVAEISEATIRLTFVDGQAQPSFELRGFAIKVDIPATLEGEGRLRIEDGGTVKAGVDANITPIGLGCSAALAFDKRPEIAPDVFLSLYLKAQFSTGLPLAQSGAAIYGFMGMFAMNGSRDVDPDPDVVTREIGWWQKAEDKYAAAGGQYALGVGVVVGTMPDVSFCFSASGMVVVAFPDPEVILGVDVKVMEVPNKTATDKGGPAGTITGLIVIDDEAVTVAVSAQYKIPKILKLKVPFGAYFPYSLKGTYVRLGSDGVSGTLPNGDPFNRAGEPVTLRLLPDTLDLEAWSYLMIEQDGLPSLGGDAGFSFDGFSVGFGAGAGLEWSAGPIKLVASIKILVGFGTDPLMIKGGLFVNGELDLVVLSISARGAIILTYLDENLFLEGAFCGEVDLFFFSIKGCVSFKIGSDKALDILEPEPPVVSIALTDRRGTVMGHAAPVSTPVAGQPIFRLEDRGGELVNTGVPPEDNHTVWPDTAPVINFRHYVADTLGPSGQFDPTGHPVGTKWFGSSRLKYAYRLDDVRLTRRSDGAEVAPIDKPRLQSVWTTSPYRQPDGSGEDGSPLPSDVEAPSLKLLDWEPWGWAVPMDDGGESSNGDPADTVEDLCEPLPQPRRACVFGRAALGIAPQKIKIRQETPAPPPYPSRFGLSGEPFLEVGDRRFTDTALSALMTASGASLVSGRVATLTQPIPVEGETLTRGYTLPAARRAQGDGVRTFTLPWEARFDRQVTVPRVALLVCDAPGAGGTEKACFDFEGVTPDGKHTNLVLETMTIRAIDRGDPFTLTDKVDGRASPAGFGQDGRADVLIPPAGIETFLREPCRQVELYFIRGADGPIEVTGLDTQGREIGPQVVDGPPDAPIRANLTAVDGLVRIQVKSTDKTLLLYRICCVTRSETGEPPTGKACENFRRLKPSNQPQNLIEIGGFAIESMNRGEMMALIDAIDQRGAQPVRGRDRAAEIRFPDGGIRVGLPRPCRAVEVWIMLFAGPVTVEARDASGRTMARAVTPTRQGVPHRVALNGATGIASLVISGGSGEAVLFRVCRADTAMPEKSCITFANARVDQGVIDFEHLGHSFEDLSGCGVLRLTDEVTATSGVGQPGRDGVPELRFADEGLRIKLPGPCDYVTIKAMPFTDSGLKAEARDAVGARVDAVSTPSGQGVERILEFEAKGIVLIDIFGGGNEAVLYEICCTRTDGDTGNRPGDDEPVDRPAPGDTEGLPAVRGLVGDENADRWAGRVVGPPESDRGLDCRIVVYEPRPPARGPWDGFTVTAPEGKTVTLLSVCAIDHAAVDRRDEDRDARDDLVAVVAEIAEEAPTARREIVLEPGEDYELSITWSWQAWQANEAGTDSPPTTPDAAAWTAADAAQVFRFRAASEDAATGLTQDGLNEHVFDARDIARYLTLIEPEDGRSVHFLEDVIWAHFSTGHVRQLLERYGRMLTVEVKRTDPPPQSSPADLATALAALSGVFHWVAGPSALDSPAHRRINDAMFEAPCLPDGPVTGGASLGGRFELEPLAMYDLNLIAVRTDGTDPVLVSGTRFTTSRYADPPALIEALGFGVATEAPFPADEIILPDGAVLPGGTMEISDVLLGELLAEMAADTLPLPLTDPRTYVVWRFNLGSASWTVEGLLIDSLESLNRQIAVETDGVAEIVTRCKIASARLGATDFTVHRATRNWTRVFLKPTAPVGLTRGRHSLSVTFETSDGGVTASRTITDLPKILEREGLS